jgi:hypothetical protein
LSTSSKCCWDHAACNISKTTTWNKLLRNSYLFFQLIGSIGSGFFRDHLRFLKIFQGNCKGNYSRLLAYIAIQYFELCRHPCVFTWNAGLHEIVPDPYVLTIY